MALPFRAASLTSPNSARGSRPAWSTGGGTAIGLRETMARIRCGGGKLRSSTARPATFGAVQMLIGHTNIEDTVSDLGDDVEEALTLARGPEV